MGLFNRSQKPEPPPPGPKQPLAWHASGDFETASCHGQYALEHLDEQRALGRAGGFTVILLGEESDYKRLAQNKEFAKSSIAELLQLVDQVDVEAWMAGRLKEVSDYYEEVLGEWPVFTPDPASIGAHLDVLSHQPHPVVYLAKMPTPRSWEAPVYIGMGGWNDCPDPAEISAFAKRWHERYGAEVISITHDVMEFVVANPPTTREDALALAKEQYLFCSDIVEQGVGDISTLAAALLNSKYWYFWWD